MKLVLVTVAGPFWMATAPLLMRIVPAASRITVMVLSIPSPIVDRVPAPGIKVAVIAIVLLPSRGYGLSANAHRPRGVCRCGTTAPPRSHLRGGCLGAAGAASLEAGLGR